jgi:hypothetical protein
MRTPRFPSFGRELERPFDVADGCFDCREFYGEGHGDVGCNAWPASRWPTDGPCPCADFNRIPDVLPGECGQRFPPSRMNGRKEPRERQSAATDTDSQRREQSQSDQRIRRRSPAGVPGGEGKRSCACGAPLPKRKRCCDDCRANRRRQTLHSRKRRLATAQTCPQRVRETPPDALQGPRTINLTRSTPRAVLTQGTSMDRHFVEARA